MVELSVPEKVDNWIADSESPPRAGRYLEKHNPATGEVLCRAARSGAEDAADAVQTARAAQGEWARRTVVARGDSLRAVAQAMQGRRMDLARVVHLETGKSMKDALAETDGAIEMGFFVAGEGRRFYGRTTTSAAPNRTALTIRQPLGVAALIVPANTPIANIAWKVFPALLCGNSAVLKAAEDSPATAWAFARLAAEAGLPRGVLTVLHGFGVEVGQPLCADRDVGVISFTGSTAVGRAIAQVAGARLAKVCLELGGKNPFVVCDDADMELALRWALLSAFSNAGQRCAAGSRILIFASVYARFVERLVERARALRAGPADEDDLGPVISEKQLSRMLASVDQARAAGARVLLGGHRLTDAGHAQGYYMAPTIIEGAQPDDEISQTEVFGPITCLYQVAGFEQAVQLANRSPFGLTAAIHTRDVSRALAFVQAVQAGVVSVNAGTYGSEPHLPFGGLKDSGIGLREAGTEALDVYSEWKTVYLNYNPVAL